MCVVLSHGIWGNLLQQQSENNMVIKVAKNSLEGMKQKDVMDFHSLRNPTWPNISLVKRVYTTVFI